MYISPCRLRFWQKLRHDFWLTIKARLWMFLVHDFLVTIKARLLVKNKNHFQQKNVYPRDPPPGNGRPHYIYQLSDIAFIGKVYSLMVTSSHIWFISPILNVPNLKVIFLVENSTILSKQTKSFTHLLLSFCKSGGTRCPCFVFTSISTSYLTSVKPNLSWTTQLSTFSADRLRFEISQMS